MGNKIPDKILKEIFPKKLKRSLVSDQVYHYVKRMIQSGRLKKGQRLLRWEIAKIFGISETAASEAILRLKKEGFIISKRNKKLYVV